MRSSRFPWNMCLLTRQTVVSCLWLLKCNGHQKQQTSSYIWHYLSLRKNWFHDPANTRHLNFKLLLCYPTVMAVLSKVQVNSSPISQFCLFLKGSCGLKVREMSCNWSQFSYSLQFTTAKVPSSKTICLHSAENDLCSINLFRIDTGNNYMSLTDAAIVFACKGTAFSLHLHRQRKGSKYLVLIWKNIKDSWINHHPPSKMRQCSFGIAAPHRKWSHKI